MCTTELAPEKEMAAWEGNRRVKPSGMVAGTARVVLPSTATPGGHQMMKGVAEAAVIAAAMAVASLVVPSTLAPNCLMDTAPPNVSRYQDRLDPSFRMVPPFAVVEEPTM